MAARSMINGVPSLFIKKKWVPIIDYFRDQINRAIFLADCDGHCTVVDKIKILPADRVTEDAPVGTIGATSERAANSDYAAALKVRYEYLAEYPEHRIEFFRRFCEKRLHSAKAPNDA
jgi:hypothetical protein